LGGFWFARRTSAENTVAKKGEIKMSTRQTLSKKEDRNGTLLIEFWFDNDYAYFSYTGSAKKGNYLDIITEQSTRVLPEILAKQIFWDRLKQSIYTEIPPFLKSVGISNDIEFVGEPDLRLSNNLEYGAGLGKLLAAVSYDFHHWVLVGFAVTFRVRVK
jgi:hypothetical protein